MNYNFDTHLSREGLYTAKWESEFERKNDYSLLPFGTADMDFKSAQPIIDALTRTAQKGHFGYPDKPASYYASIINYHERKFNWKIAKEWIQNGVGIYSSMGALLQELTTEGDEVLYMTPVHHIFAEIIEVNRRTPVEVPLLAKFPSYDIDFLTLEKSITERSKILFLCNPHNPMGRIWTAKELTKLQDICIKNGIIIISDEVYSGLLYKGESFTPLASLSKASSMNTITVTSASKSFNLTGLKHSLVISENPEFKQKYLTAQKRTNMFYGGSLFGQVATEVAFSIECDEWTEQVMVYVEENYRFSQQFFSQHLPEIKIYQPQATYFLWADFSAFNMSNAELISFFENSAHIIVTNGKTLGSGGDNFIRFNLGCPREQLSKGLERIIVDKYNHQV
ncbi:MalY/PatB family protein [Photorhabdus asymbiotica]|uniref:MalY/PatB family protein n=1 Tax=Photorhabdus asymbiotica TaxID=291112 RepID=UPI003DA766CA